MSKHTSYYLRVLSVYALLVYIISVHYTHDFIPLAIIIHYGDSHSIHMLPILYWVSTTQSPGGLLLQIFHTASLSNEMGHFGDATRQFTRVLLCKVSGFPLIWAIEN